jgi:hypothetical protein
MVADHLVDIVRQTGMPRAYGVFGDTLNRWRVGESDPN